MGHAGQFKPGNPGKPKGAVSQKTKQWEALGDAITGRHADTFNEIIESFMLSSDPVRQEKGCLLYLQSLEYFKPKQARVTHAGDQDEPVQIIVSSDL